MTRTDTIAMLDKMRDMVGSVIEWKRRCEADNGDPKVSGDEAKRIEKCVDTLAKAHDLLFETAAVCYRVRDEKRNRGDYEQAEFKMFGVDFTMPPEWYRIELQRRELEAAPAEPEKPAEVADETTETAEAPAPEAEDIPPTCRHFDGEKCTITENPPCVDGKCDGADDGCPKYKPAKKRGRKAKKDTPDAGGEA